MENAVAVNQPYDVQARLAEIARDNEVKALKQQLADALAEKERLQALALNRAGTLTIRPSKHGTGTLCVYGLSRQYPVSLYKNQWRKLAAIMPQILAELDAHPSLYPDK